MNKDFWKALLMRSVHAIWETAVSTLPATIVITPAMIEHFDLETVLGIFYVVLAWALTSVFSGVLSAIKSAKAGMPEVQLAETLYSLDNKGEGDPDYNVKDETAEECDE